MARPTAPQISVGCRGFGAPKGAPKGAYTLCFGKKCFFQMGSTARTKSHSSIFADFKSAKIEGKKGFASNIFAHFWAKILKIFAKIFRILQNFCKNCKLQFLQKSD